ncbi:LOW QUALITY PROTEIN: hypothetical protein MC885_003843 [Smutsia gigantea]|nr:LOW QUALITY PROTEIN: hypothetical protein MC885_003843 [Smutsia gigantea]
MEPCFVFPALLCVSLLFPPLQPKAPSQPESSLKTVLLCIDTGSSCSWSLAAPMVNRQAGCRAPRLSMLRVVAVCCPSWQVLWTGIWKGVRGAITAIGHTGIMLDSKARLLRGAKQRL